jgi:hypothetical protein
MMGFGAGLLNLRLLLNLRAFTTSDTVPVSAEFDILLIEDD